MPERGTGFRFKTARFIDGSNVKTNAAYEDFEAKSAEFWKHIDKLAPMKPVTPVVGTPGPLFGVANEPEEPTTPPPPDEDKAPIRKKHTPVSELGGMPLTEREHQVLEFIAQGLSREEITKRLEISPDTFAQHLMRGKAKIGLRGSRSENILTERAREYLNLKNRGA